MVGVESRTVLTREHQSGIHPRLAPCRPLCLLTLPVFGEYLSGVLVEPQRTHAGPCLWRAHNDTAVPRFDELLRNVRHSLVGLEVGVPPLSQQLPATHRTRQREVIQRAETLWPAPLLLISFEKDQERHRLFRCPRRDLRAASLG